MSLKERVVLITGAAGGIGDALSRHFRSRGALVAGLDRTGPSQGSDQSVVADVTNPEQVARAVTQVEETLGPIEVLINNAAITDLQHHHLVDLPIETWRRVMDVNVTGAVIVTKAVLPGMIERQAGNIVFITSSLGQQRGGIPGDAVYSASKAAVEMISYVLSQEVRQHGVNVNTLYPSVKINTGFFSHLPERERDELASATLLNETAEFLAALPRRSLSGISLCQEDWDGTPGYADDLRRRAAGEEPA